MIPSKYCHVTSAVSFDHVTLAAQYFGGLNTWSVKFAVMRLQNVYVSTVALKEGPFAAAARNYCIGTLKEPDIHW